MEPVRLIPTAVVLDRISMSKTQMYRQINAGNFPKPVPVGRQRIAFVESEVNAWIEKRIRDREEGIGADARRARALKAKGV